MTRAEGMSMLEKAARAAFESQYEGHHQDYWWGNTREDFIREARAVLMAIREPDENIDYAGAMVGPDTNAGEFSLFEARNVFTTMIDAILNEPQS